MIEVTQRGDTHWPEASEFAMQYAVVHLPIRVRTRLAGRFKEHVRRIWGRYPGRPSYPLRWASLRQKRFVMAKLQEQGGPPYQRSGRFGQAFDLEVDSIPMGVKVTTFNEARGDDGQFIAQYIIFDQQQPFHFDTGWTDAMSQMDDYHMALGEAIQDEQYDLLGEGFRRARRVTASARTQAGQTRVSGGGG